MYVHRHDQWRTEVNAAVVGREQWKHSLRIIALEARAYVEHIDVQMMQRDPVDVIYMDIL